MCSSCSKEKLIFKDIIVVSPSSLLRYEAYDVVFFAIEDINQAVGDKEILLRMNILNLFFPHYVRRSRAKASKPGLSEEYICVQTSVTSEKKCVATAINRATPSKDEIFEVFGDRIVEDTVILCDGNANYSVLNDKCTVAHTERINKVNGFHSFINVTFALLCTINPSQ